MIKLRYLLPMLLLPVQAFADNSTCLGDAVSIPSVVLDKSGLGSSQTAPISASVMSSIAVPLAGIMVEYQLWSLDRPAALATGTVSTLIAIPGGLLPEEIFEFDHSIWLDDRARSLAEEASSLEMRFVVKNALSSENKRHSQSPSIMGWAGSEVKTLCN